MTRVFFASAHQTGTIISLDQLLANFKHNGTIVTGRQDRYRIFESDIREALDGLGWYEGLNDHGRFLILAVDKFHLLPKVGMLSDVLGSTENVGS